MAIALKICGLTSLADARFCAGAGVDYLGFIFHPESPRYIEPARVREISDWLHGPELVGVFVDEAPEDVNDVADAAGLTCVQLHGDESPEMCREIALPVIKAIRVADGDDASGIARRMRAYDGVADLFLLDTYRPDSPGGTGETFDWSIAAALAPDFPLLLSGGINAQNVRHAVETVRPLGVDLSSGVELEPGNKDFDLLGAFFDEFGPLRGLDPTFSV